MWDSLLFPFPFPVVDTRLPTQVPTVGEAYILPFTCLSVHHPGSHSSSPSFTDTSNYLVPTIDSYTGTSVDYKETKTFVTSEDLSEEC